MTMTGPAVDLVWHPAGATDLVVLAHGGQEHSTAVPHLWRAPILRMWPFALAARSAVPTAAVGMLRYRYRGWNGSAADSAVDLRAVLDELPPVIRRVVLIGHSMGGRAVVAAGNHPRVAGVLALAPWLPEGEPLTALRPPVTFAHGTDDTITDPRATAAYAERLRAAGTPVTMYALAGEGHAMLRRSTDWNTVVANFTITALNATAPARGTDGPRIESLPQYGPKALLPIAVGSIAVARFRLPVVERFEAHCSAGKSTAAGRDLG
ncbi:alpha/beta hydrolase [Kribbella sp. NPDC050241]|uniref:alpha/beta hydrolase n=1 Tax=Kribbella sp. NPDC050241 TaxID=3364115 RepID=UPI00378E7439